MACYNILGARIGSRLAVRAASAGAAPVPVPGVVADRGLDLRFTVGVGTFSVIYRA